MRKPRRPRPSHDIPPPPGPLPAFQVPAPERLALSNGIPVLLLRSSRAPLTDVMVAIRAGASSDPADLPGVADWTATMLGEGAAGRSALDFADAVDFLGASLSADADWEWSLVSLHVPTARAADALGLMADMIIRPDFPAGEWDRLRENRRTAFLEARDDPRALARIAQARAGFGPSHRYGTPLEGTPASLEKANLGALAAFHEGNYRPERALLVVSSDLERADLVALLERAFGDWRAEGRAAPPPSLPEAAPPARRDIVLVDKPGSAQSVLLVVGGAPRGLRPLSPADDVMNTLLGGSFKSRLNDNLRETHGYTYGARSTFDLRGSGGVVIAGASVETDVTAPAVHETMTELERIAAPTSEEETTQARRYLGLGFPARFETGRQTAAFWAWASLWDIDAREVAGYMTSVEAVDPAALEAAAKRDIRPERMRVVIVGDRRRNPEAARGSRAGPHRGLVGERSPGAGGEAGDNQVARAGADGRRFAGWDVDRESKAEWDLRERVKELTCLYGIAQIAERPDLSLEEILSRIANLLPSAWQYTEVASARIVLDGVTFGSNGFAGGAARQEAEVQVLGRRRGSVEVCYTSERPAEDEGPFLEEERSLILEVARQIGVVVQRREAERARTQLEESLRKSDRLATFGQTGRGRGSRAERTSRLHPRLRGDHP